MRKRKRNNGLWLFRSDRLELKERGTHLLSSSTPTGTNMGFMSQVHFSTGPYSQLEKEMVTHFSILAWKIPWTEKPGRSLVGYSPRGHKESDTTFFHRSE